VVLGIVGSLGELKPRAALVLAFVALALQWSDLSIWRSRIAAVVDSPDRSVFGPQPVVDDLRGLIENRGLVRVVPRIFCSSAGVDYGAIQNVAAMEVQLLAARANARMPSVFLARGSAHCDNIRPLVSATVKEKGVAVVLADPNGRDYTREARRLLACRAVRVGVYCVSRMSSASQKRASDAEVPAG
jgi:hypothetical protein